MIASITLFKALSPVVYFVESETHRRSNLVHEVATSVNPDVWEIWGSLLWKLIKNVREVLEHVFPEFANGGTAGLAV